MKCLRLFKLHGVRFAMQKLQNCQAYDKHNNKKPETCDKEEYLFRPEHISAEFEKNAVFLRKVDVR